MRKSDERAGSDHVALVLAPGRDKRAQDRSSRETHVCDGWALGVGFARWQSRKAADSSFGA